MVKDGRSNKHAEHHPDVDKLFHDFETASIEIVDAYARNPLNLELVGEFVDKKKSFFNTADPQEMYKEALYKLNRAQALGGSKSNDKLWSRLWDRFHDLDRSEQDMFVEFASFIEEQASNRSWTVSRKAFINHSKSRSPRISLQNLTDKSFIAVKRDAMVSMHNHFRAMGRKIAADRVTGEKNSG